ncbi:MAG: EamA family transporter [Candidatus Aenigmatarchaeota archaeon]
MFSFDKKSMPVIGAIAIAFAAALWGIDGVLLRPSLYHLDVAIVVFIEHAIAFCYMAVFLFIERKELKKLKPRDWGSFAWVGLFGGAIGTMAITSALFFVGFIQLSVVILLQKLQPIFAILLAAVVLKEKPQKNFFIWAAIALIGSYLLTFGFEQPVLSLENKTLIAAGLSLVAAFAFGSSTTFSKRAIHKVNFRVGTYLRFGITTLILLLIITATNRFDKFAAVEPANIATLLLIAFTTGGVAIFIYYYGLKHVPASKSTIYELAFPITAIILEFAIYGKTLSLVQWLGAAFMLFSIYKIVSVKVESQPTQFE